MMLAAAVPAAAATLIVLWFAGAETSGFTPFSMHPENLAEAAAMGNAAETVRRLSFGQSPYRVERIRGDIIGTDSMQATALEAAVMSKRLELIRLLDSRGAFVGDDVRRNLSCLAEDFGAGEIQEYLGRGLAVECEPGVTRLRIIARTHPEVLR